MPFSSQDILNDFAEIILSERGDVREFDHCASPNAAKASSLIFAGKMTEGIERAGVIVTNQRVAEKLEGITDAHVLVVQDVRLAMALMKQRYDDTPRGLSDHQGIHPSAIVAKDAKLGDHITIGPYAVIGSGAVLGNHCYVGAASVIEDNAKLGSDCRIENHVTIGAQCELGDGVIVKSNSVIGGEGYGFAKAADGSHQRIPHTGKVILENDVRVGSMCCIDRATFSETRIARGVKIDNLVHLAHNVSVGEDSLLIAQTGIAGSSSLGARVICTGQSGVADNKTITDDVVLTHRAAVFDDIYQAGIHAGTPARPLKEYNDARKAAKKIKRLEEQVKKLKE